MSGQQTTLFAVRLKESVAKMRGHLGAMAKTNPANTPELLRLSALISYELTNVTQIQPTKKK